MEQPRNNFQNTRRDTFLLILSHRKFLYFLSCEAAISQFPYIRQRVETLIRAKIRDEVISAWKIS